MKYVVAKRGVCIGVDRHLVPGGAPVPVDDSLAGYLVAISAVEVVADPEPEPEPEPTPAKAKKEK